MIDFAQLRAFAAVAAELHFGRAAQRLNMTQPPLSRQIQLLEQTLGVQLLIRSSRSVQLTEAGRAFLPEAMSILQRSEAAVQIARRAAASPGGVINVAFIGSMTYGFLPRLVLRVREELPGIRLVFHEMVSVDQLKALAMRRIDVGFMRPTSMEGAADFASTCVQRETLTLAIPKSHPLAGLKHPDLKLIDGEPFIMYSMEGEYLRSLLLAAFAAEQVQPRVVQQMSRAQAIVSLVSTGMGLAIVPEETRNACFESVVFRPIRLGQALTADLNAVWRADDHNPTLQAFLRLATRFAADQANTPPGSQEE